MKNHFRRPLPLLSLFIVISSCLALAQEPHITPTAQKEMNIFRRTITKYQNIYDRYKRCRANECTTQEKETLEKELRSVATQAAIVGTGIIILTTAGITAFVLYKKKHQAPTAEPGTEGTTEQQEPIVSPEQEQRKQKEAEEKQRQESEQRAQEQERQQQEQLRKQQAAEEKQRKEQEELQRKQEAEQQRLEERRRKEEERIERQRKEEEDRRAREEEKRLEEQRKAEEERQKAERIRLQQENTEKGVALTRINTKFLVTQQYLSNNQLPTPRALNNLKMKYENPNLTREEANAGIDEVKTELTLPIEKFITTWKQLIQTIDAKKESISMLKSKKEQTELEQKLETFNRDYRDPLKDIFANASNAIEIKGAVEAVTNAIQEFNQLFIPQKKSLLKRIFQ